MLCCVRRPGLRVPGHLVGRARLGPAASPRSRSRLLERQLDAMKERLHSMFQTAADLIGASRIEDVLARIADRAAVEVRAPRYLLAVRMPGSEEIHLHHRGSGPRRGAGPRRMAARSPQHGDAAVVAGRPRALQPSRIRPPAGHVRRRHSFFPQERELLEVYARYAASALDSATSLLEAERRYRQSSALLGLARALAAAGTSQEVANRLTESIPDVVDCDRVGIYLWDPVEHELKRTALTQSGGGDPPRVSDRSSWAPTAGSIAGPAGVRSPTRSAVR